MVSSGFLLVSCSESLRDFSLASPVIDVTTDKASVLSTILSLTVNYSPSIVQRSNDLSINDLQELAYGHIDNRYSFAHL